MICLLEVSPLSAATKEDVRPSTLERLAAGRARLSEFIDPRRGLVWIEATHESSEDWASRSALHLCGADLARSLPTLERHLTGTVDDRPTHCTATTCETPGWDLGPAGSYRFEVRGGRPFLVAVVFTSAMVSERERASEDRYVRRSLRRLANRSC